MTRIDIINNHTGMKKYESYVIIYLDLEDRILDENFIDEKILKCRVFEESINDDTQEIIRVIDLEDFEKDYDYDEYDEDLLNLPDFLADEIMNMRNPKLNSEIITILDLNIQERVEFHNLEELDDLERVEKNIEKFTWDYTTHSRLFQAIVNKINTRYTIKRLSLTDTELLHSYIKDKEINLIEFEELKLINNFLRKFLGKDYITILLNFDDELRIIFLHKIIEHLDKVNNFTTYDKGFFLISGLDKFLYEKTNERLNLSDDVYLTVINDTFKYSKESGLTGVQYFTGRSYLIFDWVGDEFENS